MEEGNRIILTDVAGLEYEDRAEHILSLMVDDEVELVREPYNQFDPNAVRVECAVGILGYLNKDIAARLAPILDKEGGRFTGVITALAGVSRAEQNRIEIAVGCRGDMEKVSPAPYIQYFYDDDTGRDYAYLFVDTSRITLEKILAALQDTGLAILKHGPSSRSSRDGMFYRWFCRIQDPETLDSECQGRPGEEKIVAIFKTRFPHAFSRHVMRRRLHAERDRSRKQKEEMEIEVSDLEKEISTWEQETARAIRERNEYEDMASEIVDSHREKVQSLENQLMIARAGLQEKDSEINRYTQQLDQLDPGQNNFDGGVHEVRDIIAALVPSLEFLRDSMDEITLLEDRSDVLGLLGNLASNPEMIIGERIRGAKGWLECRFHRGRDRNGRLYYKKSSSGYRVLVSNKNRQKDDIRYMKRF